MGIGDKLSRKVPWEVHTIKRGGFGGKIPPKFPQWGLFEMKIPHQFFSNNLSTKSFLSTDTNQHEQTQ